MRVARLWEIDLHRRRSVIVRMTPDGQPLGTVRISNDAATLAAEISRAGEHPDVVLEATYGWYWAADVLAAAGAQVHLAHPLGVKGFAYRRVKNDVRDAADLADLLRMGRLPEAWVAPLPVRELRETVRHRAALVAIRSACKAQIHAVLAKNGIAVPLTDLFGQAGTELLGQVQLPSPFHARITSLRRLIDLLDFEIDAAAWQLAGRLARDPGYQALLTLPGVGKTLAAVFLAEIGDITRFPTPGHLASWAGLTPRHRESDTTVHRGHITRDDRPHPFRDDPRKYLWDAANAAELARDFAHGQTFADYQANAMLRAAVEREFEIIGEALNQLSKVAPDLASAIPELPRIVAFRNILIHGYATVDDALVWQVLQEKLSELEQVVRGMLAED